MIYTIDSYKKALIKAKKSQGTTTYESAMQYVNQIEARLINMGRIDAVKEIKEQFDLF